MTIEAPTDNGLKDAFVTRQPIFDAQGKVQAYELLFRSGLLSTDSEADLQQATFQILDAAFLVHGIRERTNGLPALLSFSASTIVDEYPLVFPADAIAVQIGPGIRFSEPVLEACGVLARKGYSLVLSDFCAFPKVPDSLMELADIVKVDCSNIEDSRLATVAKVLNKKAVLVAEHLDTQIGWKYAQELST